MRAPGVMCVAVRRLDGSIEIHRKMVPLSVEKYGFLRWPLVRGLVAVWQSLSLGFRALDYSSAVAIADIDRQESHPNKASEKNDSGSGMSTAALAAVLIGSLAIAVGFFFLLPLFLTDLAGRYIPVLRNNAILFNVFDGLIRVVFLILYIGAISLMPDIRRVFQYHGAEHKAIFTYEAGLELSTDNARHFSTLHRRCGTAFLLMVMVVAMLVFSFVPPSASLAIKAVSRIILLPVIAGLAFEVIRKSGQSSNRLLAIATIPGLWLQRLTTREPDDRQLEVGIAALQAAITHAQSDQFDVIV